MKLAGWLAALLCPMSDWLVRARFRWMGPSVEMQVIHLCRLSHDALLSGLSVPSPETAVTFHLSCCCSSVLCKNCLPFRFLLCSFFPRPVRTLMHLCCASSCRRNQGAGWWEGENTRQLFKLIKHVLLPPIVASSSASHPPLTFYMEIFRCD